MISNNNVKVKLHPIIDEENRYEKLYTWECPNHSGSFTYSKRINRQWGHPEDKVFCAVCCKYYDFEIVD